jgi:hypothetical protein
MVMRVKHEKNSKCNIPPLYFVFQIMGQHSTCKLVGNLTKGELQAAVPLSTFGSNLRGLSWTNIIKLVQVLSDDVLGLISHAIEAKNEE